MNIERFHILSPEQKAYYLKKKGRSTLYLLQSSKKVVLKDVINLAEIENKLAK